MSCSEPQLDRVMFEILSNLDRHLYPTKGQPADTRHYAHNSYRVVVLFLTQHRAELGVVTIRLLELRPEDDHNTILQEVVVLCRVRVKALVLNVVDPETLSKRRLTDSNENSLLLTDVNLEADNVAILDLALGEGKLRLHELDHARFDFLHTVSPTIPFMATIRIPRRASMESLATISCAR